MYELRIYGLYLKGQSFAMQLHPSHTYAQAIEAMEAVARQAAPTVSVDLNSDHPGQWGCLATCYAGVVIEFWVCQRCGTAIGLHPQTKGDNCACNFPRPLVRQLTAAAGSVGN